MPKFLGLFSNSGLTTFFGSAFFTAKGAAATFFPTFFFGYKKSICIRHN
jgi:hypothetical protein